MSLIVGLEKGINLNFSKKWDFKKPFKGKVRIEYVITNYKQGIYDNLCCL